MLSILGVISSLGPILLPMARAGLDLAGLGRSTDVGSFLNAVMDLVGPAAEAGIEVSGVVSKISEVMGQPGMVTAEQFDELEAKIKPVRARFLS